MRKIAYSGSTPGADSNTYVLFDSSLEAVNLLAAEGSTDYRLELKHSHAGTLRAYAQAGRSGTWVQFYERILNAPTNTTKMRRVTIPLGGHDDIKVEFVNGGSAQTTWYVAQVMYAPGESRGTRELERLETVRGPVASATLNFAAATSTTHAVYEVPTDWRRRWVRVRSNVSNLWFLFGTSAGVEVSRTAVVSGTPPAWTGSATIGDYIADGTYADYLVDPSWTHFTFEADAVGRITIIPSDFTDVDLPD